MPLAVTTHAVSPEAVPRTTQGFLQVGRTPSREPGPPSSQSASEAQLHKLRNPLRRPRRLGADWLRRRESRAHSAQPRSDELLGARAATVAIAVRGHSDHAVLSADRHRGPRPARRWASFLAVGAVDAFCVLGAGRRRRRGLVGGVETRLLARPRRERKGRHRRRRRVTTAASKDDSVVAHSSFASRLE